MTPAEKIAEDFAIELAQLLEKTPEQVRAMALYQQWCPIVQRLVIMYAAAGILYGEPK